MTIAIAGIGCRYPDAASPAELWENVLAQRQAFRRIPRERLDPGYYAADASVPDTTYSQHAAVLTDYEFDRAAFRESRATYESTDLAHWLALDVAAAAWNDAGAAADPQRVGVIVGNTLTGDSSRASSLRLRWPYVRRVLEPLLDRRQLAEVERRFKEPFAPVTEDTLAGSLSNTIAGRICNHFGFGGGGYAVDGACSSSLLAVIHACRALETGDLDVVLAGGVDLSLDPFELVGFAKTAALARERMWVYDTKANGFLPGEGCGFVVLMRDEDALRQNLRVYASIRGWGISSDGRGGLTRPEVAGQTLALSRAYERAGIAIDSVTLFEGHGTGTPVGDPIELSAIGALLTTPAERWIGSVKANIGHTKAAAGVAGLIKAALAAWHGVIPPATACTDPREEARGPKLGIATAARPWPAGTPRRAAVSAMGFGGINTHVVLESDSSRTSAVTATREHDAELFVFSDPSDVDAVRERALSLSLAEMTDLAAMLARKPHDGPQRGAVVASTPEELHAKLAGFALAQRPAPPKIVFLFSGQASPVRPPANDARFAEAAALGGTAIAQPAIVAASLAGLRMLGDLGIDAVCALGHSLGELTALRWAGAIAEDDAITIAFARGRAMQEVAGNGTMAAISAPADVAAELCANDAVVAAINAPDQTIVAGDRDALARVIDRARDRGVLAAMLDVAGAFHTAAMGGAARDLRDALAHVRLGAIERPVLSTVTGALLPSGADLPSLLTAQLTAPVRFLDAIRRADADLFVEVGPGRVLADLAGRVTGKPAVSVDAGGPSVRGLLECAAAVFAAGGQVDLASLFSTRVTRPFDLARKPRFIESPCERTGAAHPPQPPAPASVPADDALSLLRATIAARAELAPELVHDSSRMLADLHLSSIAVARVVGEVARQLGIPALADATQFANATVAATAATLEELRARPADAATRGNATRGVGDWTRAFRVDLVAAPLPARRRTGTPEWRFAGAASPELIERFASVPGRGLAAVLPDGDRDACIEILLAAAAALTAGDRLVIVQQQASGSAFARSLHLERPVISVRLVRARECAWIAAEAAAEGDFAEAIYADDGTRYEPRVVPATLDPAIPVLDSRDTILISGGAKGIGAETAIHLGRTTGARLLLLGRSPADDPEVVATCERLRGARFDYVAADVTDRDALRDALARFPAPSAIVHAAGTNVPALVASLDADTVKGAAAAKVDGLANLLDCCDRERLRVLVTFGSVIARTGMRGEAHYALANEWLARATEDFANEHPRCRAVCLEWSVWPGAGMGARLGAVESLRAIGVAPVDPKEALALLDHAISGGPSRVMICGRLGDPPTLRFLEGELPLLRFVESVAVHVPRVELIAEARLSASSDPYTGDHALGGEPLLPAVLGLEAMAQAASALTGKVPRAFHAVELRRPIVVPQRGATTMRIAALANDDRVELAVRSSETGFATDHFRAVALPHVPSREEHIDIATETIDVDVYPLLFHAGRFRRVTGYRALGARHCTAEIDARRDSWFHRYAAQQLLLGDPGVRDAAIHALQACVPQAVVLPAAVDAIELHGELPAGTAFVVARETSCTSDSFTYDLVITAADGRVAESWHGLRLQIVAPRAFETIPQALWGVYLERAIGSAALRVVFSGNGSNEAIRAAARSDRAPLRRADGKPFVHGAHVSASHADGITIAVTHAAPVGCDLQHVADDALSLLVSADRAVAVLASGASLEPEAVAATRVWSAREAMKKATGNGSPPLVFDSCSAPGRVTFAAGAYRIETFLMRDCIAAVALQPGKGASP